MRNVHIVSHPCEMFKSVCLYMPSDVLIIIKLFAEIKAKISKI